MADFAARVAGCLGCGPCVVVGVSMGGEVALDRAPRQPEMVAALILIAPGGLTPILRNRLVQLSAWLAARLPDALLIPPGQLANRRVDLGSPCPP
jgi:pimeloyl-ACP methyl ester carboxylesterase